MNVWIVIDGERKGPIADYEVRRGISEGKYPAETVAWHDGCAEWMPLARMALFEREFTVAKPVVEVRMDVPRDEVDTTARGEWAPGVYWMRRFWARWLDLHLYAGLWWLGLYFLGADVGAMLRNVWLVLLLYLPWVPIEAYLIARYQTTPGKWLAGIRIVDVTGANMDFNGSLRRAMRVYFLGIGMGWGIISLICQSIALFAVRSTGRAVWDQDGTHVVEAKSWRPLRGLAVVAAYIIVTQMQWIVVAPYFMEDMEKRYPKLYEWMEGTPPRHLPKKH